MKNLLSILLTLSLIGHAVAAPAGPGFAAVDGSNINTPELKAAFLAAVGAQPLDSDLTGWSVKTPPSGVVVGTTDTQTLTNKSLTSPSIATPTLTGTPVISDPSAYRGALNVAEKTAYTAAQIAALSGLQFWHAASSITGLSNGDPVSTLPDISGNGRDFTAASTARPTYTTNARNGQPCLTFDGTSDVMETASFGSASLNTAGTFFLVSRKTSNTYKVALSSQQSAGTGFFGMNDVLVDGVRFALGGVTTDRTVWQPSGATAHKVYTVAWDATDRILRANGQGLNHYLETGVGGAFNGKFYLGNFTSGSFYWDGEIYEVIWLNRKLTSTEMLRVEAYLVGKYDIPIYRPTITCIGDSLTQGFIGTASEPYPKLIETSIGTAYEIVNAGYGGTRFAKLNTILDDTIQTSHRQGQPNIALVWAGTNDLVADNTAAATVYASLVAYVTEVRSKGKPVIVGTVIDNGSDAGDYTRITDYNALIRANWKTFADGIADFANDPDLGSSSASTNGTYFQGDGTHLTAAGNTKVAAIALESIRILLGTPTVVIAASGTTGARTILAKHGRVNFAATDTSLVVTNYLCRADSIIDCQIATNDATAAGVKYVPADGSFTIYLTTAPTAETAVSFSIR